MKKLQGCGTALVTPFIEGEVDYEAIATLVERQVEADVDFLVPLATTAETPTLTREEKVAILRLVHGLAAGKKLVVGCGSNSVNATVENIRLLENYGADAWLVVTPYYNKPTQEGLYQYFKAVAAQTDKPIIMYNVPGRTGVNMTAETTLRIARDVKNIIAIKECCGKMEQCEEIIRNAPEGFSVLSGDDDMTCDMVAKGGQGAISVASNIAPAEVRAMVHAGLEGKTEESKAIDQKLKPLYKACFVESNPIPVKAGLSLMGLCTKEMRLPLVEASESTIALMAEILK